ncbi:2-succinyl-5-enolpyruvyl-6-hydroxy-3-cyclohexene-1-carboxylic-acid synthase [Companilactobacillus sp.]|uniref:2-succinyl-5-enolpyruvyl-6-hydroxy-3- cyclohexene-1-carboxylic-acid synthase n=1 Tax=Companilactobacillus sp. TaxID=2767905 RepID=UPI002639BE17|nr:2-succinyl-5-enolpyruvyl-6-hydroxy-3-cyclohexene-1-carboxylic-acid synthase [Companilactobacillus sp.]
MNNMTSNLKILLLSLISQNVYDFVISPGSRSTPVVLLLAEIAKDRPEIRLLIDVDERSASFFAIGLSKKSHQPTAIICTSGTAATEYSSAVAEAKLSNIPLVVITTDRPVELTNIGAPQAIDQDQLYGNNTKSFVEINVQDPAASLPDYISYESQRIVKLADRVPKGPVQINLPLRKPLMPEFNTEDPKISVLTNDFQTKTRVEKITQLLTHKKVLMIAGPETENYHTKLMELSDQKSIPLISDILSNTRLEKSVTLNNFDLIMKTASKKLLDSIKPDVILKFGGTLVSAPISNWLAQNRGNIEVIDLTNKNLADHTLSSTEDIAISENDLIEQLLTENFSTDANYFEQLTSLNYLINEVESKHLTEFSEMSIPRLIDETAPENSNIFLSNSMPVRDFENFYQGKLQRYLYCNRGANGIDGVVSSALGMAFGHKNNFLMIGDLALFHDMNGLMMAKRYQIPMTIVVTNNNGGGIFSFLPQSKADDYFEELFGTPQDLKIDKIAELYDFNYSLANDYDSLTQALQNSQHQQIIEVTSNRAQNVQQHQGIENSIQEALEKYVNNNN